MSVVSGATGHVAGARHFALGRDRPFLRCATHRLSDGHHRPVFLARCFQHQSRCTDGRNGVSAPILRQAVTRQDSQERGADNPFRARQRRGRFLHVRPSSGVSVFLGSRRQPLLGMHAFEPIPAVLGQRGVGEFFRCSGPPFPALRSGLGLSGASILVQTSGTWKRRWSSASGLALVFAASASPRGRHGWTSARWSRKCR